MNRKSFLYFTNSIILLILLVSVAASIFLGIEYTDSGYILGLAHRISIGQQIYFDFDYVRPPLSPLLWSLPLHLEIEPKEILIRAFVVLQKFVIAYLLYKTLQKCDVDKYRALFSSVVAFSFLMHHIPSMPWHTVDGLFFSMISVASYSRRMPIFAILFAVLAALTKQSYYFLPFVFVMIAFLHFPKHRLSISASLILVFLSLWQNSFIIEFTRIASGTTSIIDFLKAAVAPHILLARNVFSFTFFLIMLTVLLLLKGRATKYLIGVAVLFPIANIGLIVLYQLFTEQGTGFLSPSYAVTQLAMSFSVIHILVVLRKYGSAVFKDMNFQIAILLLAAAWMSSISWGYANYMFAYGFILSANIVLMKDREFFDKYTLTAITLIVVTAFLVFRLGIPYRMVSPLTNEYEMVDSGHYKYVWASEADFGKLASLEKIFDLGGCLDTYPATPQFAVIDRRIPTLRADWKMDIEFPSFASAVPILTDQRCKLFIEKDYNFSEDHGRFVVSAIELNSYQHCLVDFDEYFYLLDFSTCEPR